MAFDAGAAIGRVLLDTTDWVKGADTIEKTSVDMGKVVSGVGAAFLKIGKVAVKALGDSIKAADDFQTRVANVSTLVDTAAVDVGGMARELLLLGGELGDAKDLTGALYQALSASVEPAKAVEFVAESARFAGAAMISTEKAVDILTTSVNAYGSENLDAASASDKLFSIIKLGKTDGKQLSSVLGKSIPIAANMGVSFDELGASIAIMTRQGIKSSQATTQINGVMGAFLKPSEDMTAALEGLGFESGAAAVEQLGFKGAMDAVIETTDGSKDATARLFRNTSALKGVLALTGKGGEDYADVLDQIQNSAGASNEAFEKQEKTFETLQNQMGKLEIIVGGVAKSFVDELAVGASEAATAMIQFLLSGRGADILTDILAGVTAAFEAGKVALKPLVDVLLPSLKGLWETITDKLNKVLSPAGDTAGVFKLIAGAAHIAAAVFEIVVEGIGNLIVNLIDLIVAIKASGGIMGKFFDFLAGKAKWEEVEKQVNLTGRAFETLGKGIVKTGEDAFNGIFEKAAVFEEKMNESAAEVELTWSTTFNRTKTNTLNDFNEIITGQKEAAESIIEENKQVAESVAEENNKILMSTQQTYSGMQNIHSSLTQKQLENIDLILEKTNESFLKQQEQQELLRAEYEQTGIAVINAIAPVFESIGAAIATGESVWEAFKAAGLQAVAGVVRALGEQWGVMAAAAFVPGFFFNPVAGAGLAAASLAAFTAAGAIGAFADGGRAGAGLNLVGEKGPEVVDFKSSANVIPNDQLGSLGGNVTMQNTFIINNEVDAEIVSRQIGQRVKNVQRGA